MSVCVTSTYKYLGMYLSEHVDSNVTSFYLAESASEAIGVIIAKCKLYGGMSCQMYTKLFDSLVVSILDYASAVWHNNLINNIDNVQHRAMRSFLGVGVSSPIVW